MNENDLYLTSVRFRVRKRLGPTDDRLSTFTISSNNWDPQVGNFSTLLSSISFFCATWSRWLPWNSGFWMGFSHLCFFVCLASRGSSVFTVFENHPKCRILVFQFGHFPPIFFQFKTQNVNVARFARNVKCDFFCDFQTLCSVFYEVAVCILPWDGIVAWSHHYYYSVCVSWLEQRGQAKGEEARSHDSNYYSATTTVWTRDKVM